MDDGDVIYVERNADPRTQPTAGRVMRPMTVTSGSRVYTPAANVSYAPAPASVYSSSPQYPQQAVYYGQAPFVGQNPYLGMNPYYGQNPMYAPNPMVGQTALGSLFGGVNIGQLIDLVGQGFAAIRALPPSPTSTGEVSTDVQNLTTYQQALAEHGKLDEQIRTGVHIIAKLLGA